MIGIDIIEIKRIKSLIDQYGQKFLQKIYTRREIAYCEKSAALMYQRYAGRFVAKEAIAKALGRGTRELSFSDIEIINDEFGKPDMELHGRAAEMANYLKVVDIYVSISHCYDYAVANALLEYEEEEMRPDSGDVEVYFNDEGPQFLNE